MRDDVCFEWIELFEGLDVIGGVGSFKSWVSKCKDVFGEVVLRFGFELFKGVLFVGIFGIGKSFVC